MTTIARIGGDGDIVNHLKPRNTAVVSDTMPECSHESPSKDQNDRNKYLIKMYDGCGIRSVYFYSYTVLGAVGYAKEKYPYWGFKSATKQ